MNDEKMNKRIKLEKEERERERERERVNWERIRLSQGSVTCSKGERQFTGRECNNNNNNNNKLIKIETQKIIKSCEDRLNASFSLKKKEKKRK